MSHFTPKIIRGEIEERSPIQSSEKKSRPITIGQPQRKNTYSTYFTKSASSRKSRLFSTLSKGGKS